MSAWNYRLVNLTSPDYPEEQWLEVREVFYNADGDPCAHTRATMGGEDYEELEQTMDRFDNAIRQPVLVESDFIGKLDEESFH